jgi:hypothetical protein
MTFSRSKATTPARGFALLCLALASSAFSQATVRTQLLAQSPTFMSVNAWIKNSGPDTLKNLRYVWFMDWTDHGSTVVPELDWASVSGVTMSASLRPDYIAEARYDLGSLALAPGAEVQLNTRLHLKDWSSFQASNDWTYGGLKQNGTTNENPFTAVYSGAQRIWGYPEQRLGSIGVGPKIQIRTVKTQQSSNTLGLDVHFVNTGSVPVTGIVARWMASTAGRTSPIVAVSDWSDADSVYLRQTSGAPGTTEIGIDLGPTIIGVGRERIVKLRLVSSDWSSVDWSQDWSFSGISQTGWNERVEVEVRGYPSSGQVPDEVDMDGDGWSDAQEVILGTDPASAASRPDGIPMRDGLVQDMSVPHMVTYDASTLAGYATRNLLPLTIPAGGVQGVAPRITTASVGAYPTPVFDGALQVGSTLEILGTIQPGHSLEMPIPLVDGLSATLPEHIQVVHYVNGQWQREQVVKIENGAAYVRLSSFSPVAVGLVQQRNWLAAGDGFGLSIDKQGFPWATGRSEFGQLGDDRSPGGDPELGLVPVLWPRNTLVVAVAAGNRHGLALDAEGSVWAWGDNSAGQCGRASAFPVRSPVKVVDGTLNTDQRVVQIAAGGTSSYAVTVTGQVLSWGDNSRSQLGRGVDGVTLVFDSVPGLVIGLDSVRQVAAGAAHALALRANAFLKGWGSNQDAAIYRSSLGTGSAKVPTPVAIPLDLLRFGADTMIASGCGGPSGTGCWSYTFVYPWYLGVSSIAAGGTTSLAKAYNRKSSGLQAMSLAWGGNKTAQIGPVGTDSILIPVPVSSTGRSEISVGASHLLETWYDGIGYDVSAGSVILFYPVRGRGYSYAANPTGAVSAVTSSWNEILRSVVPRKRLRSSAVAAGSGVSFNWDSGPDTVYAWGGPWGNVVTGLSRGERTSLTILSPQQGDTLPDELLNIRVDYRIWNGESYHDEVQYLPRSICGTATPSCRLMITAQGMSRSSTVYFRSNILPRVTVERSRINLSAGESGLFRVKLPYPARVSIFLWPLSDSKKLIGEVSWQSLAAGIHDLSTRWDATIPQIGPGSYGVSMVFKYDDPAGSWDTLAVTLIDFPKLQFPKRISSTLSVGGPDSVEITIPTTGILQAALRSSSSKIGEGALMDGAWALLDAGLQRIGVWNVSDETKLPILEKSDAYIIDWQFRAVTSGIRISTSSCVDSATMNSFRINTFLSDVPALRVPQNGTCNLHMAFRSNPSTPASPQSGIILSEGSGVVSIPQWPWGSMRFGKKKWVLGMHDSMYPQATVVRYQGAEVVW